MGPTGARMRTCRPVSSVTSRSAVCSMVSPRVRRALGQRPGHAVALATTPAEHDLAAPDRRRGGRCRRRRSRGSVRRGGLAGPLSRATAVGAAPSRRAGQRGPGPGHALGHAGRGASGRRSPAYGGRAARAPRPSAREPGGGPVRSARPARGWPAVTAADQAVAADPVMARRSSRSAPGAGRGGWRRRCSAWSGMVSGSRPACLRGRARRAGIRAASSSRSPAARRVADRASPAPTASAISRRAAATYSSRAPGASAAIAVEVAAHGADVAAQRTAR